MSGPLARLMAGTAAILRGDAIAAIKTGEGTYAGQAAISGDAPAEPAEGDEQDPVDPADAPAGDPPTDEPPVTDPAAAATAAANARWMSVLASDQAKGRMDLAVHLLGTSDMTADQIKHALSAAGPAVAGGNLVAALGHDNPDLGAGGDAGADSRTVARRGWEKAIAKLPSSARK